MLCLIALVVFTSNALVKVLYLSHTFIYQISTLILVLQNIANVIILFLINFQPFFWIGKGFT